MIRSREIVPSALAYVRRVLLCGVLLARKGNNAPGSSPSIRVGCCGWSMVLHHVDTMSKTYMLTFDAYCWTSSADG